MSALPRQDWTGSGRRFCTWTRGGKPAKPLNGWQKSWSGLPQAAEAVLGRIALVLRGFCPKNLTAKLRDETGAMSVLMVFLIPAFILIFAAGLDLTKLNAQRRAVQAQADLTALSAARRLPDRSDAVAVAQEVTRQSTGSGPVALGTGDVLLGRFTRSDGFEVVTSSSASVDAVAVTLHARFRPILLKPFLPGELWVVREAVVLRQDTASLSLRNALLRMNASDSLLLRGLLGEQLGLNLALLSWEGLLGVQLSLSDLADLISTQVSTELLSFQDVLDADVGLGALLSGLAARGVIPAAAIGTVPPVTVRLSQLLTLSPEVAALSLSGTLPDVGVSVQNLLSALAQLSGAKTHHLVNVTAGLSAAPLADPTLGVQIVDPGTAVIGRINQDQPLVAEAAQVVVRASGSVAGLIRLNAEVQVAAATVSLQELDCRVRGPDDILAVVEVQTHPITLALEVALLEKPDGKTYNKAAPVSFAGHKHQVTIRKRDLGKVVLVPNTIALSEVTSALTISIGALKSDLTAEKNRLGPIGIIVAAVLASINALLNSVTNLLANTALLNSALQSLLDLLGIRLAQAEVVLNGYECKMALVR